MKTINILISVVMLWCVTPACFAADAHSTVAVSAYVQAVARVQQTTRDTLVITSADIQRGYVEVIDGVHMKVSSNSSSGYALDVLPITTVFSGVVVRGLDGEVVLGPEGGAIVQRWQHAQTVALNLRFQFALRPDAQPGEYNWPLQVSVRPL